MTQIKYNFVS